MTFALLIGHGTLDDLLATYGYAAVLVFVAVESLGVPFPGETMLIAAALYAARPTSSRSAWSSAPLRAGRSSATTSAMAWATGVGIGCCSQASYYSCC